MNIAVIGDGAMGSLFGSLLSLENNVYILSIFDDVCKKRSDGFSVLEKGEELRVHPHFTVEDPSLDFDLVLLFVKGSDSESALSGWKELLARSRFLLTLQNGAGHEEILRRFLPEEKILIGVTEENAALVDVTHVNRGGRGETHISPLAESADISDIIATFNACTLKCDRSGNLKKSIWRKILTNSSLSAATAILGCSIDFLGESEHAFTIVSALLEEAVKVASADGYEFDYESVRGEIHKQCLNAHEAHTSIEKDLANGRRTECENITGYVVRKAKEHGINAPCQSMALSIIHSLEDKNSTK